MNESRGFKKNNKKIYIFLSARKDLVGKGGHGKRRLVFLRFLCYNNLKNSFGENANGKEHQKIVFNR